MEISDRILAKAFAKAIGVVGATLVKEGVSHLTVGELLKAAQVQIAGEGTDLDLAMTAMVKELTAEMIAEREGKAENLYEKYAFGASIKGTARHENWD